MSPQRQGTDAGRPACGWYLFGITAHDQADALDLQGVVGMPGAGALAVVSSSDVAAIVQPVPLSDFGAESLAARMDDVAWIKASALRHHATVTALHQRRPLLPARFGAVYASPDDVAAALAAGCAQMRAQLRRVEGCDEWGLRLYANMDLVLPVLEAESPPLAALRAELAAASPGRAYLLRRRLDGARLGVLMAELRALAQRMCDMLALSPADEGLALPIADARQANKIAGSTGEHEILRVSVLVPRARLDDLLVALETCDARHAGLRWTRSGPWPPYSFATPLAAHVEDRSQCIHTIS